MATQSTPSSQETDSSTPSEIASSSENRDKGKAILQGNRFSFSVQAKLLKQVMIGLVDIDLNPDGLGEMEVCHAGFQITVYQKNDESREEVFGFLSLDGLGLIGFSCRSPIVMVVDLVGIDQFLESNACDDDIVKVFNVDGSDILSFDVERRVAGSSSESGRLTLESPFSNVSKIKKFQVFTYGFEIDIPKNKLEPVLDSILELPHSERPLSVTMDIDTTLTIQTGSAPGNTEAKVTERKTVWMTFPYWESLKKSISLADPCTLWLATRPNSVVFRFDLKEMGEFMYLKYVEDFFMQKEFPTIGTFRPLCSG